MTVKDEDPRQLHKPQLPRYNYIETESAWQRCLKQLQQQPRIAVDLEANSMYAYQEQVCLIQISIPDVDYIIDPLAGLDLEPFGALIEDAGIEKVFHAAEYDLILLKREFGWEIKNLFDTMWAARILGYQRIGLANLLGELYGLKLDKRYQRANWCRRPLSEPQLAYAQADTHYLLDLRDAFARELEAAGRMAEAAETFIDQSYVEAPLNSFDPDSFWSINGVYRLPAEGKAILRDLNIFRDEQARRRDQPPFKIFPDKTLLEIARARPQNEGQLWQIHGMSGGQIRRYGKEILRIVRDNRGVPAPRRPRRSPRPPEDVLNRYDRLRTWRKEQGEARGVESDVIMSRAALWELARANPQTEADLAKIESLGPWRRQAYGDEILRLLSG